MAIRKIPMGKWMLVSCAILASLLIAGCSSKAGSDTNTAAATTTQTVAPTAAPTIAPTATAVPRGKISVAVYDYANIAKDQGTLDKTGRRTGLIRTVRRM